MLASMPKSAMPRTARPPVALTIAGSDCSGGAGLEADLKTFAAHGVYGMAAVTCVVAENPRRLVAIQPMTTRLVREQLACCLEAMPPVVVKTGMLFSAPIIRAVNRSLGRLSDSVAGLVVDPVMVATSGARLLQRDAIRALMDLLADHADAVTPNLDEAEILAGQRIRTEAAMEAAARNLARRFSCAVLIKGGHLRSSRQAADFFWDGTDGFWLRSARVAGVKTHGTGCTYSAAVVANLAQRRSLAESLRRAKRFVTTAIRRTHRFGPWMALNHNDS